MISLRQSAKRAIEFLAAHTPSGHVGRLVVAYHGVRDDHAPARGECTLHVRASTFGKHLRMISAVADVVSLQELLEADVSRDRLVAITFDDAYASALRNGVSQCESYGFPSCVFVAPGLLDLVPMWDSMADTGMWSVDDREHFLRDLAGGSAAPGISAEQDFEEMRIAGESELRLALESSPLMSLGNHTWNHLNLGLLATGELRDEVEKADSWLRSFASERYLPYLAYPFGIPPRTDAMKEGLPGGTIGFLASGAWMPTKRSLDPTSIPRWNVSAEVSDDGFRARLLGRLSRTAK